MKTRTAMGAFALFATIGCGGNSSSPTGSSATTTVSTTTTTAAVTTTSTSTTTTALPTACGGTVASIVSLDKQDEIVVIRRDAGPGDMTGWYLVSTLGNQRFDFPDGFVIGTRVEIHSGPSPCSNSSTVLCWTTAFVWNNEETETAQLFNCQGTLVDSLTR